jgi:beta-galactosidase
MGMPAVTNRARTTYLAGSADEATLTNVYRDLCAVSGLSPIDLPTGVEAVRCRKEEHELLFLFNHSPGARTVAIDGVRRELLSGARIETRITIAGHDVAVLAPALVHA